jgi:alkylation response protein AidB-like acyl-CoA dehydrogenase
MGTHVVEMSEKEQQRAIHIARELASEFARVGPACDEKNTFPHELVSTFQESGLVGLPVSKQYGGLGGDIWTVVRVMTELAKGDGACALAFNMHYVMAGILAPVMKPEVQEYWMRQIAEERKIICGPFSEARAGTVGLADTVAIPTDGGWRVTGKKNWGTLSQGADIVGFNATITDRDGNLPSELADRLALERVFVIPMDTPGISIKETWDVMGMRATGTQTVVFDDVFVPTDADLCSFRLDLLGHYEWAAMLFSGVYYGMALRAFEETQAILCKKNLGATMAGLNVIPKHEGYVQLALGEMLMMNETTDRVIEATARRLLEGRDAEWNPLIRVPMIDIAKVVSTENVIKVVDAGMRTVGGSSYRRGHPLERLYRDARSGLFHQITTELALDLFGKFSLGLIETPSSDAGDS